MTVICLVGMPGGGKSTVGRQLGRRLGWHFYDTDALVERQIGCSIRSFFESQGEDRFRDVEASIVNEVTRTDNLVLATGGGAVLREENRRVLQARCQVVYLRSAPEELFRRIRHDVSRPLLQVQDPLSRLRELYEIRDPIYRSVANFVVDTGHPSVSSLVNVVLMQLELAGLVDPTLIPPPVDRAMK